MQSMGGSVGGGGGAAVDAVSAETATVERAAGDAMAVAREVGGWCGGVGGEGKEEKEEEEEEDEEREGDVLSSLFVEVSHRLFGWEEEEEALHGAARDAREMPGQNSPHVTAAAATARGADLTAEDVAAEDLATEDNVLTAGEEATRWGQVGMAAAASGHLLVRDGEGGFLPLLPRTPVMQLTTHELADLAVSVAVAAHPALGNSRAMQRLCYQMMWGVRIRALLPECLADLEAEDSVAFCWAFARVGMLDQVMVRVLSDAVALRVERRAANLTQQLDLDGWQLHPQNSLFDDDARAPPQWATELHVLGLVRRAMAVNCRDVKGGLALALSNGSQMYALLRAGCTVRACMEGDGEKAACLCEDYCLPTRVRFFPSLSIYRTHMHTHTHTHTHVRACVHTCVDTGKRGQLTPACWQVRCVRRDESASQYPQSLSSPRRGR